MLKVGISFDDTVMDQLRWARGMRRLGILGTFYITPSRLGEPTFLSEEHVARIASWGHQIGNHLWDHIYPKSHPWDEVLQAIELARQWLDDRGYEGNLLALPNGVNGGGWTPEQLRELEGKGFSLRDVRSAEEGPMERSLPSALEWPGPLNFDYDGLDLRYFHGSYNTNDDEFVELLRSLQAAKANGLVQLVLPPDYRESLVKTLNDPEVEEIPVE